MKKKREKEKDYCTDCQYADEDDRLNLRENLMITKKLK